MSDAEIMVILIYFTLVGFRCFKHITKEYVCVNIWKHFSAVRFLITVLWN